MTFAEFQASGRDCPDLGEADKMLQGTKGRLYGCDGGLYWIEDATDWPTTAPGYGQGRWYTLIGRAEFQSDNLAEVERPLFEFAVGEGQS